MQRDKITTYYQRIPCHLTGEAYTRTLFPDVEVKLVTIAPADGDTFPRTTDTALVRDFDGNELWGATFAVVQPQSLTFTCAPEPVVPFEEVLAAYEMEVRPE